MIDFNQKVFSIFKKLEYRTLSDKLLLKNDKIIEKETIEFVVRIIYKEIDELVSKFEIENFNEELIKQYKIKGYLITNTTFDIDYSNNLYLFDNRIRLFDVNEINRLFAKVTN
jgi:hypothetical protein